MPTLTSSRYFLLGRSSRTLSVTAAAIILSAYVEFPPLHKHYNEAATDCNLRGSFTWTSMSFNVLFVDARVRKRYIEGDLWRDEMEVVQAAKYYWYKMKSPIYFYGRTCGKKMQGARILVAKLAEWSIGEVIASDRVKEFLLHVRFLLETYGWKIVTDRENEPRLMVVIDFENAALTPLLTNWFGVYLLFHWLRPTLKAAPLTWRKTFFLNPPYLIQKIVSYGKTITSLRWNDIIIPQSPEETTQAVRDFIGEDCLPESFGGRSTLPLDQSDVEQAFQRIALEAVAAIKRRFRGA